MKQILRIGIIAATLLVTSQGVGSEKDLLIINTYKAEKAALKQYLHQEQERINKNCNLLPTDERFQHQRTYCIDPQSCRCLNPISNIQTILSTLDIIIETQVFNSKQKRAPRVHVVSVDNSSSGCVH